MRIEQFSGQISDALQTELTDFRHEQDLYSLSPVVVLATYYMAKGSEGLKELPKYESLPGMVPHFFETPDVTAFRSAVNYNTGAIVLGNMIVALDDMMQNGVLDWSGFKNRHRKLTKGTLVEGKIALDGLSMPRGRVKPGIETLREKATADPTLCCFLRNYAMLPYELEMVMQRPYSIRFDTGLEEQSPVGRYVQEIMRDSFEPLANDILQNGLQQPIPQRFLDFLGGEEIREDVVAFLASKT